MVVRPYRFSFLPVGHAEPWNISAFVNRWPKGFSYNIGQSYEKGIFRGKRAMLSFTTGGPEATYGPTGKNGRIDELLRHVQYGMLHFIGMDVLPPFIAYSSARVTPEQRTVYLDEYRARQLSIASTAPMEFSNAEQR